MNSKTSIVDEFLLKGLIGMSRAISKNRMSAHPAAAMLAAYFFCVENALSTEVQAEVYDLVKTHGQLRVNLVQQGGGIFNQ